MLLTPAERRLLALLVLLLGAGYAVTGLTHLGLVPTQGLAGSGATGGAVPGVKAPSGATEPVGAQGGPSDSAGESTGVGGRAIASGSADGAQGRRSGHAAPPATPGPQADTVGAPGAGRVTCSAERASPFRAGYLDLNAADSLDLLQLPGIGPSLAGGILALRRQRGRFDSVEELRAVRGIGEKRFAKLVELVDVGPACRTQ